MNWLALIKSPIAWLAIALAGASLWLTVETIAHAGTKADLAEAQRARDDADDARKAAERDRDAALIQNVRYAMAEKRRSEAAEAFRIEQARIQERQRATIEALRVERDDIDRTLAKFVAQFSAAPESCQNATRQMEVACAAFSDY